MPGNPKKNMWGNSSPFNKGGTYINPKISHLPLKIRFPVSPNHKANSLGLLSGYRPHLYSYWVPWWWLCRWRRMLRVPAPAVMFFRAWFFCGESFRLGHELGEFTTWFSSDLRAHKTAPCQNGQNYIQVGLFVYTNVLKFQPNKNRRGCLFHWVLVGWFLVFFLGS